MSPPALEERNLISLLQSRQPQTVASGYKHFAPTVLSNGMHLGVALRALLNSFIGGFE